ncbi:tetratricopeptide repeat protein [Dysgonomonas gadei]|uniref:tetratricopeptide repeat protein n=1 Tax=Dysgonomonas gadei TaxID=156974 RepID=UPI003AF07353
MIAKQLFCLTIIVAIFFSCKPNKAQQYFNEAELLEQKGKTEEAIRLLDKAIAEDTNLIAAYINRGASKSMLKDYMGAIADYTAVIKIDSTYALAYLNRGKSKKRIENYNDAILDFNTALKLKGYGDFITVTFVDNPFFHVDEDREYLEPTINEILYERGIAYFYIDSLKQAFSDFSFCISEGNIPQSNKRGEFEFNAVNDCYYWRGFVYLKLGYKDKGCKDLHKAAELGITEAIYEIERYCK